MLLYHKWATPHWLKLISRIFDTHDPDNIWNHGEQILLTCRKRCIGGGPNPSPDDGCQRWWCWWVWSSDKRDNCSGNHCSAIVAGQCSACHSLTALPVEVLSTFHNDYWEYFDPTIPLTRQHSMLEASFKSSSIHSSSHHYNMMQHESFNLFRYWVYFSSPVDVNFCVYILPAPVCVPPSAISTHY